MANDIFYKRCESRIWDFEEAKYLPIMYFLYY